MSDEQDKLKLSLEAPKLFGRKKKAPEKNPAQAGVEPATEPTLVGPVDTDTTDDPTAVLDVVDDVEPKAATTAVDLEPVEAESSDEAPLEPEPVATKPAVSKPAEPVKPVAKKPVAKKAAATKPVTDEPVTDEPAAADPVADEPVATKPAEPVKPVAKKPVAKATAGKPVTDEPIAAAEPAESTKPADKPKTPVKAAKPAPKPAAKVDEMDQIDQIEATDQASTGPLLTIYRAAALTGLAVGASMVALTWLALRGCEAVRGTSSCGGGPGFLLLVATFALCVLLGSALLRAFAIPDPGSSSFLAVGLVAVIALMFLVDYLDSIAMLIVIPVLSIGGYLASVWVTKTFVEPADR